MNHTVWGPWRTSPYAGVGERRGYSTGTNYRQCPHGFAANHCCDDDGDTVIRGSD